MKAFAWHLRAGFAAASLAIVVPGLAQPGQSPGPGDVEQGIEAWLKGDFAEAVRLWRPRAIEGDADAQYNIATAYKLGRGVEADLVQAEHWYQLAAAQGHEEAADNYGLVLFQNGRRAEAMPWLEKSVARGDPRAQYILGTALFNGDIVAKDWIRGYALVTRASSAGLSQASRALVQMDEFMPLDQRQQAMVLAREIEAAQRKPSVPDVAAPPPVQPAAAAKPVGAPYPVPGGAPAPASVAKTVTTPTPVPASVQLRPAAVQTSRPAAPKAAVPAGDWRIQLGAFSDAARARSLWSALKPRVKGLGAIEPFYVKAGAVTRLQAGPFGTKVDADRQCAAVKVAGQACMAVKP